METEQGQTPQVKVLYPDKKTLYIFDCHKQLISGFLFAFGRESFQCSYQYISILTGRLRCL